MTSVYYVVRDDDGENLVCVERERPTVPRVRDFVLLDPHAALFQVSEVEHVPVRDAAVVYFDTGGAPTHDPSRWRVAERLLAGVDLRPGYTFARASAPEQTDPGAVLDAHRHGCPFFAPIAGDDDEAVLEKVTRLSMLASSLADDDYAVYLLVRAALGVATACADGGEYTEREVLEVAIASVLEDLGVPPSDPLMATLAHGLERIGTCAVDSGRLMLLDPAYVADFPKGALKAAAQADEPVTQLGVTERRRRTLGVVASTGIGDGLFPVYAERDGAGRVRAVSVRFDEGAHAALFDEAKPKWKATRGKTKAPRRRQR